MWPALRIGEGLYIPTYFLVISIAFSVGIYWIAKRSLERELNVKQAMDICLYGMVGSFLGARLFHVFYELPQFYLENPLQILYVWQGGFVFYGGLIGASFSILIYAKIKQVNLIPWANVFAPPMALAYVLGRFATLLSGSGFGRPTLMPWGITYPPGTEAPPGIALHPTPVYAMIWEFSLLVLLLMIEKKKQPQAGSLFFVLMIGHGLGRIVMEIFRNDFRGQQLLGFSVSTWLSLGLIGLAVYLWRKNGAKLYVQTQ